MAVQAHWLAFYADRFIKETSQLNPIEVAVYYRLFESYAQTGHLVDDLYILCDIAKLNSAMPVFKALTGNHPDRTLWSQFIDATIGGLLSRFFVLASDGTFHHEGWDTELVKAAAKYEARAKGGRNSSLVRHQAKDKNINEIVDESGSDIQINNDNQIEKKNTQREQEQENHS